VRDAEMVRRLGRSRRWEAAVECQRSLFCGSPFLYFSFVHVYGSSITAGGNLHAIQYQNQRDTLTEVSEELRFIQVTLPYAIGPGGRKV
jgi:hypothetical protein